MKYASRWAALLGILLAVALFAHEGFGLVASVLRVGGYGLLVAALIHVLPMMVNARAWQVLMPTGSRTSWSTIVTATWIRESINGLLPVARIGGEVAAYRSLTGHGLAPVPVVASLMVDMVLSVLSQSLFALMGVLLLFGLGVEGRLPMQLAAGFAILFMLGGGLVFLQRSRLMETLILRASRHLSGRWSKLVGHSAQIDLGVRAIYAHRGRIARCVAWQSLGWLAGAAEVWCALYVLGHGTSIGRALLIEAFIQTIASVAFIVPGAYGIQEGAFLVIGAAVGLDGPVSLALAASRRLRDVVIFIPGLVAWSLTEARNGGKEVTIAREG